GRTRRQDRHGAAAPAYLALRRRQDVRARTEVPLPPRRAPPPLHPAVGPRRDRRRRLLRADQPGRRERRRGPLGTGSEHRPRVSDRQVRFGAVDGWSTVTSVGTAAALAAGVAVVLAFLLIAVLTTQRRTRREL